jgi:hypothetical protein
VDGSLSGAMKGVANAKGNGLYVAYNNKPICRRSKDT